MMPLGLLGEGRTGEVLEIRPGPVAVGAAGVRERFSRVEELGIRVGRCVQMLNNGGGPLLLKVGDARLALDRGLAMKIMIREVVR